MEKPTTPITLGEKCRDTATNFTGTAEAHIRYLDGVDQVRIQVMTADGGVDELWVPAPRLEQVRGPTKRVASVNGELVD